AHSTRTQSPTALWSVRYGLTYAAYVRDPLETFDLTGLGLPRYMKDQATFSVFPRFAPDGYSPIGTEGYLKMDRQEGVHHVSGSYSKILGGHTLKAGAEMRWNFLDYAQPGYPSGQFTFGRGITCRDRFSCPGGGLRHAGGLQVRGRRPALALRRGHEQPAAACQRRLRAQSQDFHPSGLRVVLHPQPGHRLRPYRRRLQRQLHSQLHPRLQ